VSATKLGYKNVFILPVGLLGWKQAGKPLEKSGP
jgi:rhodanese-related sulfurtransferase